MQVLLHDAAQIYDQWYIIQNNHNIYYMTTIVWAYLIGLFMGNTLPYYTEGYCTLFNWHLQESTARSSLNHNWLVGLHSNRD